MIYLDSSVVLARLLTESRRPPPVFWDQAFVSSRLLQFEVVNRLNAYQADTRRTADADLILEGVELFELSVVNLTRALRPFPVPVRTLDGLHLATMDVLRSTGLAIELASYDVRLLQAAEAMGFFTRQP